MTASTQLQFLQNHKPLLQDGEYKITVTQTLEIDGNKPEDFQPLIKTFQVAGERFQLKPQDIHGVFPPNHNLGEHSNVLPHIILNRSTLPWERKAQSDDENTPWLALLVFDQEEVAPIATSPKEDPTTLAANADKVTTKVVSLSELEAGSDSSPFFPKLTLEKGQKPTDKVKVIDVPMVLHQKKQLEQIMPTAAELQFLTHVRKTEDDKGSVERAVIIANRLPKSGNRSVVHLVSVEDRFKDGTFNYQKAGDEDKIRLVSLKSWEFTCMERYRVTDEAIEHLKNMPLLKNNPTIKKITERSIHLSTEEFFSKKEFLTELKKAYSPEDQPPSPTANGKTIQELLLKAFGFGDFASILKKLDRNPSTLRLPDTGNDVADQFLKMGYVPASHYFRKGDKAVSWYHGPLSPLENPPTELNLPLPPRAADHLLRYYENIAMLDASYAAAWELGRLLALQDKSFSTSLYRWKRCHAHQLKKEKQQFRNQDAHHPGAHRINREAYRLPKELTDWFYDLHLLKGLPFNYLVPDEAMLPSESIRFFTLDKLWMACLIDGAFSIGRVITHDHSKDENLFHAVLQKAWNPEQKSEELKTTLSGLTTISGCLIRSEVVSGWPGLLVEAYKLTKNGKLTGPIQPIRMETLSQNVLLLLFEGQIQTLDIHLKPETIHFGFSIDPNDPNLYHKKLRKENGEEHDDREKYTINFSVDSNTRVVKITDNAVASKATEGLVKLIQKSASEEKEVTSAEFALQMIEGVEKVTFIRG